MIVVDHVPQDWFLLRDELGLVLDVNCAQSFASFSVVLRLTDEEACLAATEGREAIGKLVRSIQYRPAAFADRAGGHLLEEASDAAIKRWQATRPAP